MTPLSPKEFPFGGASEQNEYRVFPEELESDEHVLFHGTAEARLPSILANGFAPGRRLPSVSFAHKSSLPLRYACEARRPESPCGVVIAVRFDDLTNPFVVRDAVGAHVYNNVQPEIIGYCVVPADYVLI